MYNLHAYIHMYICTYVDLGNNEKTYVYLHDQASHILVHMRCDSAMYIICIIHNYV